MKPVFEKFFLSSLASLGLATSTSAASLEARLDEGTGTITIHRDGLTKPLVTQHAAAHHRPYLHPIVGPDGNGVLTEYSPGHHRHQTGLYWGFTRVNGRDYFHHPSDNYWKRKAVNVLEAKGESVKWETVYDLLDADGNAVLTETQRWAMRSDGDRHVLDLEWRGQAQTDVTIGKYDYGGLFLRMPWKPGTKGEAVNAARNINAAAEGQRAMWLDVGMEIAGRDDWGTLRFLITRRTAATRSRGALTANSVSARFAPVLATGKLAKAKPKPFDTRFTFMAAN